MERDDSRRGGEPGAAPAGFEAFVAARYPALVAFGALLAADAHRGEDLAQMGLMQALRAWRRLHPHGDSEAYVRVVMTRYAIKAGRRRWRGEVLTESLPETGSTTPHTVVDDALDARRLLANLPAQQRVVLVLLLAGLHRVAHRRRAGLFSRNGQEPDSSGADAATR